MKQARTAWRRPPSILRDVEVHRFIRDRQEYRMPIDIHAALVERFDAWRVPSRRTLLAYLAAERRAGQPILDSWGGRRKRDNADGIESAPVAKGKRLRSGTVQQYVRVHRFVLERMDTDTIDTIRAQCAATFPADQVPSRSALGRFVKAHRTGPQPARGLAGDGQVASFVRARAGATIDQMTVDLVREFPERAKPSRSAVGRLLRKERGGTRLRQMLAVDQVPELGAMVRALAGSMSLDRLHAACAAAFPDVALARSSLARAVAAELLATYGVEGGGTRGAGVRRKPSA